MKARLKFVQASTRLGETDHTGGRPNGGQMRGAGAAPRSARSSGPARNTNGTTALRSRPTHLPAVSKGSGPRLSEVGGRRGICAVALEGEMLLSACGGAPSRSDKF